MTLTCSHKCYHCFDLRYSEAGTTTGIGTPMIVADDSWYLDSGATNHVTADISNLTTKVDYKGKGKLVVANGFTLSISYVGSFLIHSSKPIYFKNIFACSLHY